MIITPQCYKRNCKHYQGVKQPNGTEQNEFNYCPAFPNGIPDTIAYGIDNHLEPLPEQENDVVYEEAEEK